MVYTILCLVILSLIILNSSFAELKKQNKDLIKKINYLSQSCGHPELSFNFISEELEKELIYLCKQNKKVQAVKLLRENTALNLLEAKQYVDTLHSSEK